MPPFDVVLRGGEELQPGADMKERVTGECSVVTEVKSCWISWGVQGQGGKKKSGPPEETGEGEIQKYTDKKNRLGLISTCSRSLNEHLRHQ